MIEELLNTVVAYANETGIPVIGTSQAHTAAGCVVALEDQTLYVNQEEAQSLGFQVPDSYTGQVEEITEEQ